MKVGEQIELSKGSFKVIACQKCGDPMVDLTRDQIGIGDLVKLKLHGVKLSNPDHKQAICIPCEIESHHPFLNEYAAWSSLPASHSDDSGFFGGSSSGGDSGGFSMPDFGGFGGGGFSGGGASGGF